MNLFQFLLVLIYFIFFVKAKDIHVKDGKLNEKTLIKVNNSMDSIINYSYNQSVRNNTYLRAYVVAFLEPKMSVLIILKDSDSQVIFMKLTNYKNVSIVTAERTICPVFSHLKKDLFKPKSLMVEVSTQSMKLIEVNITIESLGDFNLELEKERNFTIDITSPTYFLYEFKDNVEQVNINVESTDNTCMIFSIQKAVCPVYDLAENVKFKGIYQSVTKSGSITFQKSHEKRYFIVFVINHNDIECTRKLIPIDNRNNPNLRKKTIFLRVNKVPSDRNYIFPVFGMIAFYLSFFVASLVISFIYHHCCRKTSMLITEVQVQVSNELIDPNNLPIANEIAGTKSIYSSRNNHNYNTFVNDAETSSTTSRIISLDSEDGSFDSLSDISTDPNLYRLNKSLSVSDLSKKKSTVLDRKYFLYLWYLIIISVFYALPVVQLVITYQKVVRTTGNEDMCYYNFKCTRPFYIFTAFNNIISNIGYVLLGVLFTLITWRRNSLYNECKLRLIRQKKNQGIPQYYGLFYAMGVALTMEGILSACYHICPSNNNFQFDTAYMYILACLCMIKIYQTRHPDVNASAHSFFMTMSFIIFVGVIGVVYNILLFWIFFTISYITVCILLTTEIYYMGRWSLDIGLPRRVYLLIVNDRWSVFVPIYQKRMIFLVILNVINITFALFGVIKKQNDFASFFLAIFMFNLLIYFGFYIIMKMKHCEHFHVLPIIYVVIAIFCWGFAIYCFINHTTDWQLTPAQSREQNQNCLFLDFYDLHDVWHFLSSMSMFFSFLALQNLDDSLFNVDRDKIPVF